MEILSIIAIALGLAMDAFAVSIASGAAYKQLHIKHIFLMAIFFAGFQAIMPLVGFGAGQSINAYIDAYDHWVAFIILAFVGGKMIFEAFELKKTTNNPAQIGILLALSIATSIDALAVGFTLSFLSLSIFISVAVIGIITFVLSILGVYMGKRFGHLFENKIEIIGGVILILIGVKILLQALLT
jgi:manganese efflux pump family protein